MTTSPIPAEAPGAPGAFGPAVPSWPVRARDVLACEWTKLRSVRSNGWTLLIAAVVTLGVTAIVAASFASAPAAGIWAAVIGRPLLPVAGFRPGSRCCRR